MRHNTIHNALLWVATATLLCGCVKDELPNAPEGEKEQIECALQLNVSAMESGTELANNAGTRAGEITIGDATVDETTVKNLWVVQFNSSEKIIGQQYIADATDLSSVSLVPTTKKSTVYYIANTFNPNLPLFDGMSITEVEDLGRSLTQSSEAVSFDANTAYLLMSGKSIYAEGTTAEASKTVTLHRTVAKISIAMSVEEGVDLTITNLEVFSVPQKLNYIVNETEGNYPVGSDFATINYTHLEYTNGKTLTFYMPENKRGVAINEEPKDKSQFATPGSTCFKVYTTYTDENDYTGERIYTFYLGGNLTNDFNIKRNTKYYYQIRFTEEGDALTDNRIEQIAPVVDFTTRESSNCYILNPSSVGDRIFYIPTAEKINTFWGGKGYEDVSENVIEESDQLTAEIIWGDNYKSLFTEIAVENTTYNDLNALKVTIPTDIPHGNVVVGVRRSNQSTYLWSWHLWITDYNPDVPCTAIDNVYRYAVTGGEIHRYKDKDGSTTIWGAGGELEGKFTMDRDLGHINNNNSYFGETNLYYQYGRKDPFPGENGTFFSNNTPFKASSKHTGTVDDYGTCVNYPYRFVHIAGSDRNWCTDEPYIAADVRWNDPLSPLSTSKKSFFDPSPLGWRVTMYGTMNGLSGNLISHKVGRFSYYIDDALVETFSKTGLLSSNNGALSPDDRGLYWYDTPASTTASYAYKFQAATSLPAPSYIELSPTSYQAWGFHVRCVQE